MKLKKEDKAITLVALVVTIILLLILSSISMSLIVGNNGLFSKAKNATDVWEKASKNETELINKFSNIDDEILNNLGINGDESSKEDITNKPNTDEANGDVTFSTNYGKIEIIWIDTNNKVINNPNSPENHLGGMIPVKWDGTTEVRTTKEDSNWYNYAKIEGNEDNLKSKWANAINTVDGIESILYGYQDMHIE